MSSCEKVQPNCTLVALESFFVGKFVPLFDKKNRDEVQHMSFFNSSIALDSIDCLHFKMIEDSFKVKSTVFEKYF